MQLLACPVCGESYNAQGRPFASPWALALQIANKARAGSDAAAHLIFAIQAAPALGGNALKVSSNDLAERIQPYLVEVLQRPAKWKAEKVDTTFASLTPQEKVDWIEHRLHDFVRQVLVTESGEDAWWPRIPVEIRKKCASRREEDRKPSPSPYQYTDLVDLVEIMCSQSLSGLFMPKLSPAGKLIDGKKAWKAEVAKLNTLRNQIKHPPRRYLPDDEDLRLLDIFHDALNLLLPAFRRDAAIT